MVLRACPDCQPSCLGAAAACGWRVIAGSWSSWFRCVCLGMYLWVHRWVQEAVKIRGTDSLQTFQCSTAKNDCSDYSCSTLQYHFWIAIKRWGVCLTLLLIHCSSDSHLTKESPASEQQSRDPGRFSIFRGSRTPVLVLFLPFIPFPDLCWLCTALVPAWPRAASVAAAGEGVRGCL